MSLVLYDYLPSGNGYKCRLVLKVLGMPYELRQMDILHGATRTPEYLAINANGKIPVLVVEGREPIAESHAIIAYLAEGSALVPADPYERALMWQWMCFEQYQLEPGVATVRFWLHSLHKTPQELGDRYTERFQRGKDALAVLNGALAGRRWLVGESVSLADYPAIVAWIAGFKRLPWYAPITEP